MDTTAIIVGICAAIGPTLMGAGAWRAAQRANVQATAANKAVNDRPIGDPTISEQIDLLVEGQSHLVDRVGGLAAGQVQLGDLARAVAQKLDMHLAHHQAELEATEAAKRGEINRRTDEPTVT